MQGFVPERSFTKDRRVIIDMCIDSVLMVCGTTSATGRSRIHRVYRRARQPLVMAQAGLLSHADTVDCLTQMAKEIMIMPRLNEYKQPEAAQIGRRRR